MRRITATVSELLIDGSPRYEATQLPPTVYAEGGLQLQEAPGPHFANGASHAWILLLDWGCAHRNQLSIPGDPHTPQWSVPGWTSMIVTSALLCDAPLQSHREITCLACRSFERFVRCNEWSRKSPLRKSVCLRGSTLHRYDI